MLRGYRQEVIKREKLLIVCPDETAVREQLGELITTRVIFREMDTNDTWARDHGGISVFDEGTPCFMISCSMAGE